MTGKILRAAPMAALALLLTSASLAAADKSVPNWCGEFIGEYDILGIANCGKGQSFSFSLLNRAGPEVVLDGVAGLEKKNGRKGNGSGLDFSLSKGDGKITIRLQKEYQDRKEGDDRYAGTYVRLDEAEVRDGALVAAGSGKVQIDMMTKGGAYPASYAAALTAVTAIRSALGDELFVTEAAHAVAALAGLYKNSCSVYKHISPHRNTCGYRKRHSIHIPCLLSICPKISN